MANPRNFSVAIVIPALNEEIGLRTFLPQIQKDWYDELIVVDGNSTDGSQAYVREFGATLVVQSGRGYENAITDGMAATKSDVIIIFSPDGNCVPSSIPLLIAKMSEGYDMVIASRYFGGMKSEDDTVMTTFGNWAFTTLINLCFRANYTDSLVNYRAYRRHVAENFLLEDPESIYILEPAMSIECAKNGLRISEVPGYEPPRIAGERKTYIIKPTIRIFRYIFVSLFSGRHPAYKKQGKKQIRNPVQRSLP